MSGGPQGSVELSIVIPVYDEAESLRELFAALAPVAQALTPGHEIVFVDDGSPTYRATEASAPA